MCAGSPLDLVLPETLRWKVAEPLLLLGKQRFANVDIRVRVKGGGHVSQIYGAWGCCWQWPLLGISCPSKDSTSRLHCTGRGRQLHMAWKALPIHATMLLLNTLYLPFCSHPPGHREVAGRFLPEM